MGQKQIIELDFGDDVFSRIILDDRVIENINSGSTAEEVKDKTA